jgi:hypothetical protein
MTHCTHCNQECILTETADSAILCNDCIVSECQICYNCKDTFYNGEDLTTYCVGCEHMFCEECSINYWFYSLCNTCRIPAAYLKCLL